MIDYLILVAAAAFGWGLSLATYSFIAQVQSWPMGALHYDFPALPVAVGIISAALGLLVAYERGIDGGGWVVVVFGLLLAAFWTGFMRVGSQSSLFLAPMAAVLVIVGWIAEPATRTSAATVPAFGLALQDR